MAQKTLLLCIVLVFLTVNFIECGRFGSRSSSSRSSSSRSSSSRSSSSGWGSRSKPSSSYSSSSSSGRGYGSHSYPSSSGSSGSYGSSHKYPSSSSGSSGSGYGSHSYPSSWSGLSGGSSSSGSKYPSSLSGLSGSGYGSHSYPSSGSGLSGGSSSSGSKYPSSLSGLSGSGYGSHSYPSSGSGLSGGSSSSGSKYPSSLSGLSGTGYGSHNYPSSSTGLSGGSSSSGSKYPSSLGGLSGTGYGSHNYPSSSTGLSGGSSGSGHKYPSSSSGWSGSGLPSSVSNIKYPPSSTGLSGTGTGFSGSTNNKYTPSSHVPSSNVHHSHNYGLSGSNIPHSSVHPSGIPSGSRPYSPNTYHPNSHSAPGIFNYPPTYYSSPQYVYVNQYRNSGSRYSDILTGLTMYNLMRSHTHHYHDHYYYDDYYRKRHYSSENRQTYNNANNEAVCTLRIKENNNIDVLKIPCEIVSTFTATNKTTSHNTTEPEMSTVCVANPPTVNNTAPSLPLPNNSSANSTALTNTTSLANATILVNPIPSANSTTVVNPTSSANSTTATNSTTSVDSTILSNSTTSANYTIVTNSTTSADSTTLVNSTSPANSTTVTNSTTSVDSTVLANSTTSGNSTTLANSTSSDNATNLANTKTSANSTTLANSTVLTNTITNSPLCSLPVLNGTDPLAATGSPINANNNMECSIEIRTRESRILRTVDCKQLIEYSKVPEPKKENTLPKNENILLPSKMIISVCWVAGAGVGFLPLFGWHKGEDSAPGCYFVEVMDYNYLLFLYFATIVTPSVLLAAFYTHIYRVVIKQMSAVVTVEGSQGRGGTMLRVLGAAQKREVKATQNLAIIVFFFIICWIPLYTINAIKAFMPELDIPNTLTYFCIIFSHLNSAINPLLYAYHLKDFRAALKRLICSVFGRGVPIPAAYRPPVPVRRPALERCNALRERPKVYVNSPVWLRQKEAEMAAKEERKMAASTSAPDMEPFLSRVAADGSSGRHTPEIRQVNGPYLIKSSREGCQSPYKRVEDFIRRVRSLNSDHS